MKRSTHKSRLDALEAILLKYKARMYVFFHVDDGAVSYEEREAAFRAENGVGPGDELHSVRITFDEGLPMSRLRMRIEKLEQAIQPKDRLFIMREDPSQDIEEQIAAYEAKHGVTARDLLIIRRTFNGAVRPKLPDDGSVHGH